MNVLLYLSVETLIWARRGIFVELERGAVANAGGSRFVVGTACSGSFRDEFFYIWFLIVEFLVSF